MNNQGVKESISVYFAARRALGLSYEFLIGCAEAGTQAMRWHRMDHGVFDGIGGLADRLHAAGAQADALPEYKTGVGVPSALERIKAILRYVYYAKRNSSPAASKPSNRPDPVLPASAPPAWHCFDIQGTSALYACATRLGVSLNSLLLAALHNATMRRWPPMSGLALWNVPVNLRGLVRMNEPWANHVSCVAVGFGKHASPSAVHAAIKQQLQGHQHWAVWDLLNAVQAFKLMRHLVRDDGGVRMQGTLSNLGRWTVRGPAAQDIWAFVPPVAPNWPVGAGATEVNGRLCLAVHLDHSVNADEAVFAQVLNDWVQGLLEFE